MKHFLALFLILCITIASCEFVDEIGPAPKKVHVLSVPHARYSVAKHSALKLATSDFSEVSFKLAHLINEHRRRFGLHPLLISPSLMFVANAHSHDLAFALNTRCGVYSWTEKSPLWKSCCSGPSNSCFENRVEDLTGYPGVGVELAFATNYTLRPETVNLVLSAWTASAPHNDVILNHGVWSDVAWKSIGVGVNPSGYATVWFGAIADPLHWTYPSESPIYTSGPAVDPVPAWFPTQSGNWRSTQWFPTQWIPTQWIPFPTQNWRPTQWFPTQNWRPTQWFPHQWFPTPTPAIDPMWYQKEESTAVGGLWRHIKNHLHEFWMVSLSVLVVVLLISNVFMFRHIRKLRQELKIAFMTTHGTSCAIPEKC